MAAGGTAADRDCFAGIAGPAGVVERDAQAGGGLLSQGASNAVDAFNTTRQGLDTAVGNNLMLAGTTVPITTISPTSRRRPQRWCSKTRCWRPNTSRC